jgi:hypothetical protein
MVAALAACGDDISVREPAAMLSAGMQAKEEGAGGPGVAPARTRHDAVSDKSAALVSSTVFAQAAFEQKLIRTAESNIEVDSVERAIQRIDSLARQRNAFVADVNVSNDERAANARLVIRVPVAQFTSLLQALAALGTVRNQSINTEDITKEYADLETRLAIKEQTVARLRTLLATRTGQLDDVLNVERELARVVTELEQLKGERNYYDQRVAVSTITVSLHEPAAFARAGFWAPIGDALRSSVDVLSRSVSALIYLVAFLVPWILIAALGWFIAKRVRLSRRAM